MNLSMYGGEVPYSGCAIAAACYHYLGSKIEAR